MNYFKCIIPIFTLISVVVLAEGRKELTASSEILLWRAVNKTIAGVSSIQEAFILVPADYEDKNSPFIPINIRKFI